MEPEEQAFVAGDQPDALETIAGIGSTLAEALRRSGIQHLADLSRHTPKSLATLLREQAGVRISSRRIATDNWIGQARVRAYPPEHEQITSTEAASMDQETAEGAPPANHQHAGFSVFFDHTTNDQGEDIWHTRVYHDESGEEATLQGSDPAVWVQWILERTDLPERTGFTPPEAAAPLDLPIDILDVQLAEAGKAGLVATVLFQVSGPTAAALTREQRPFRIETYIVHQEHQTAHAVASQEDRLQPDMFVYTFEQNFPVPAVGSYDLHTLVLLLPPVHVLAVHHGPVLTVVG